MELTKSAAFFLSSSSGLEPGGAFERLRRRRVLKYPVHAG
jgi:hypothetical protein